jgi:hypothetical protein
LTSREENETASSQAGVTPDARYRPVRRDGFGSREGIPGVIEIHEVASIEGRLMLGRCREEPAAPWLGHVEHAVNRSVHDAGPLQRALEPLSREIGPVGLMHEFPALAQKAAQLLRLEPIMDERASGKRNAESTEQQRPIVLIGGGAIGSKLLQALESIAAGKSHGVIRVIDTEDRLDDIDERLRIVEYQLRPLLLERGTDIRIPTEPLESSPARYRRLKTLVTLELAKLLTIALPRVKHKRNG